MASRRFSVDHVSDDRFLADLDEVKDASDFARLTARYERERLRRENFRLAVRVVLGVAVAALVGVGIGALFIAAVARP